MNPYIEIIDLEGDYNGQPVKLGWRGGVLGDHLLGDILEADGETVIQPGATATTALTATATDFTTAGVKAAFRAELGMDPES